MREAPLNLETLLEESEKIMRFPKERKLQHTVEMVAELTVFQKFAVAASADFDASTHRLYNLENEVVAHVKKAYGERGLEKFGVEYVTKQNNKKCFLVTPYSSKIKRPSLYKNLSTE